MKRFEIVPAAWNAAATDTEMTRYAEACRTYMPGRARPEINRAGYSGFVIRDTFTGRRTFHNGVTASDAPTVLLLALNAGNAGALAWFERTAK